MQRCFFGVVDVRNSPKKIGIHSILPQIFGDLTALSAKKMVKIQSWRENPIII